MKKPVSYLQTDAKWKNTSYSVKGESTTIGRAGCGPTAAAMVVATLRDSKVTPVEACKFSLENNYKQKGGGTYANFFPAFFKKYDLKCQVLWSSAESQDKKVTEALKNGDWVIACMGPGLWTKGGHYILAYGTDGTYVYVNDPASTSSSRTKAKLSQLLKESKYYAVIDVPAEAKVESPQEKFIKAIQKIHSLGQTGVANTTLLNKTITLKKVSNPNGTQHNKQKPYVVALQTYLKALNIYKGDVHGFFDTNTEDAVKDYQKKVVKLTGNNVDGIITAKKYTWKKLLKLA